MAKSDRIIKRAVVVTSEDGKTRHTYKPGEEDELGEVLDSAEAERLTGKGYLEGNWKGSGKAAKSELAKEPAKK